MPSFISRASLASCSRPTRSLLPSLPSQRPQLPPHRPLSSPPPPPAKDPSHPNLYYHPAPPARLALSFLPQTPSSNSRTVLGHLPSLPGSTLEDFVENPSFRTTLHSSIKTCLAKGRASGLEFEAEARPTDGYITLTDERAIPPAGRIGETEDLIGSVFVREGKIVAETYEPLPSYRLVTANGPLVLPPGLAEFFVEELEKIDQEEKGSL